MITKTIASIPARILSITWPILTSENEKSENEPIHTIRSVRGVRPRAPRRSHAERSRSMSQNHLSLSAVESGADEDVCRPQI